MSDRATPRTRALADAFCSEYGTAGPFLYKVVAPIFDHAHQLERELTAAQFVPGLWRCPKCGFVQSNNIIAPDGVFANTTPELSACPNDGRDMEPVTWQRLADENQKFAIKLMDEKSELQTALMRIHGLGTGPDQGSTGWQAEQAHQISRETLISTGALKS